MIKYITAGLILYGLFFLVCYLGTGSDKKNMRSFYSYPDSIQDRIREDENLSPMIPKEQPYYKSFVGNCLIFTVVFLIIGLIIRTSGFMENFLYFLILGEGLNAFDLLIIDLCWWRHSRRIRFQGIEDGDLYLGAKKHVKAFLRAIPVFAVSALLATVILQIFK